MVLEEFERVWKREEKEEGVAVMLPSSFLVVFFFCFLFLFLLFLVAVIILFS